MAAIQDLDQLTAITRNQRPYNDFGGIPWESKEVFSRNDQQINCPEAENQEAGLKRPITINENRYPAAVPFRTSQAVDVSCQIEELYMQKQ